MKDLLIQDPLQGPAVPALGWVPAPRYLLRRSRITRAQVAETSASVECRNENSGVDRSSDGKWFPLLKSWPGKEALMVALIAQRPFLGTETGNDYLPKASERQ